jgi:hypothetical protein
MRPNEHSRIKPNLIWFGLIGKRFSVP